MFYVMKATLLYKARITLLYKARIEVSVDAFAELVLWELPVPSAGSKHKYKYRLALVINGEPVMRYDNERGKGDHRHIGGKEEAYVFTTPEKLFADFTKDIERLIK